jgi:[Skp1-protein]-hydroxyproline N-acetylglucosaminyltransferase
MSERQSVISKRTRSDDSKTTCSEIALGVFTGSVISFSILGLIFGIIALKRSKSRRTTFPVYEDKIDTNKELEIIKRQLLNKKDTDNVSKYTKPTIFVALSSFRDPELCITIEDLLKKAAYPERIRIGVVEQNDPSDDFTCHAANARVPQDKVKIITMKWQDAKGPTLARSLCESLWDGEEYYLLCDSHMRFEPGWDVEILEMLYKTKRPKRTVITWYCEGYERHKEKLSGNLRYKIIQRRGWRYEQLNHFNGDGIVEFESVTSPLPCPKVPQLVPMFSANFAFSHSDFIKEVPYQPNTPFLFMGEELFMTARAYTNGWDLVGMTHSLAYHLWDRSYRSSHEVMRDENLRQQSVQWIKDIMLKRITDGKYGLGHKRTVEDFWNYLGIDLEKKIFTRPHKPWHAPKGWIVLEDEYLIK